MKETTIEPYLPMLERFEEFFREELASRLSVESVDSVMEAAVENFHRISAIIPDVPPTSPWVKNIIGIAYGKNCRPEDGVRQNFPLLRRKH